MVTIRIKSAKSTVKLNYIITEYRNREIKLKHFKDFLNEDTITLEVYITKIDATSIDEDTD